MNNFKSTDPEKDSFYHFIKKNISNNAPEEIERFYKSKSSPECGRCQV